MSLLELPYELVVQILDFCHDKTLLKMERVCKIIQRILAKEENSMYWIRRKKMCDEAEFMTDKPVENFTKHYDYHSMSIGSQRFVIYRVNDFELYSRSKEVFASDFKHHIGKISIRKLYITGFYYLHYDEKEEALLKKISTLKDHKYRYWKAEIKCKFRRAKRKARKAYKKKFFKHCKCGDCWYYNRMKCPEPLRNSMNSCFYGTACIPPLYRTPFPLSLDWAFPQLSVTFNDPPPRKNKKQHKFIKTRKKHSRRNIKRRNNRRKKPHHYHRNLRRNVRIGRGRKR